MENGLEVLCGLSLDGARLTEVEDLAAGRAVVGCAVFGPSSWLRDLELRLGLADMGPGASPAVRVARWSARLAELAPRGRFYTRSYDVDSWGTAAELLRIRDTLVDAGWEGVAIDDGGERLAHLSEVEALGDPPLPPGLGDRLRAIATALAADGNPGYARIRTAEPIALWSHRWQKVFAKLLEAGCRFEPLETIRPRAPPTSDLGRMQQHLLEGGGFVPPAGDGTLIFLRGETVWETAHATAGLLRAWHGGREARPGERFEHGDGGTRNRENGRIVVIRSGDALPLDLAIARAGLPTQGVHSPSRLRPLLQVLPLALELVFEPKDPYRVLELIALPEGPFRGIVADQLADALAEMPGLGSETWHAAKMKAAELIRKGILSKGPPVGANSAATEADATMAIEKALRRVTEWIEAPGHPRAGAPRSALLAAVERVKKWLHGRIVGAQADAPDQTPDAPDHDDSLLKIAHGQAAALAQTLTADPRTTLGLVQVRQLVEAVVGTGGAIRLGDEQAGRIDHVDSAAALLRSRGTVVWWGCTSNSAEAPRPLPFSSAERAALAAGGVHLGDARAAMAETAAAWRRAVMTATNRFVVVAPRVECGEAVAVHPFWDELTARMGGERRDLARVSLSARNVLRGQSPLIGGCAVGMEEKGPTALPSSRAEWLLPAEHLRRGDRASASSIETLIGCPLRWALHYRAGLRSGNMVALPEDQKLYGILGHRLVELLHRGGAFKLDGDSLRSRARATLDDILPKEGATLLLAGRRGELAQLRDQLVTAVLRLADLLHRSKLEIVEVEKEERIDWQGRTLEGYLDLLLENRQKEDVVLDLKWGRKTYADKLKGGTAVQLAVYAFLRKRATTGNAFPAVAYFSLSRGSCLATDDETFDGATVVVGADTESTWRRTEVTLRLIEARLDTGRVPVTGILDALPVIAVCGGAVDPLEQLVLTPDAGCEYCAFDPVCGRRWDAQR